MIVGLDHGISDWRLFDIQNYNMNIPIYSDGDTSGSALENMRLRMVIVIRVSSAHIGQHFNEHFHFLP